MRKDYLVGTALLGSIVAGGLGTSMTALAQETSLALEEVVVTARKREESLQDVPISVTAITDELDRASMQSLQDVQNFVPNVLIDQTPANNGATISIRGISFQETDKSLDPPVGVVLDGVYLGVTAGQLLNNFDLERVEVLRGPQGTLFGKNTIAGAVNVIRTAPTKEWGVKARLGAGSRVSRSQAKWGTTRVARVRIPTRSVRTFSPCTTCSHMGWLVFTSRTGPTWSIS